MTRNFAARLAALGGAAIILAAAGCASSGGRLLSADRLMGEAGSWQPGDALPPDLVEFRAPRRCLAVLTDTAVIFQSVSNLPLLEAMLWDSRTPDGTWNAAAQRSLHLAGPTAFFADVRERARTHPAEFVSGRLRRLLDRSALPHARAEAMFIDDGEMPPEEARSVLEEARTRVEEGEDWMRVFVALLERYREPSTEGPCPRSKIEYLGEVVVSAAQGDDLPLRELFLGGDAVPRLLAAAPGALVLVRDPAAARTVLFKVTETYRPSRRSGSR